MCKQLFFVFQNLIVLMFASFAFCDETPNATSTDKTDCTSFFIGKYLMRK